MTTLCTCKNNALIQQIIMGTNIAIHCVKFYHFFFFGAHYPRAHDICTESALRTHVLRQRCTGFLLYSHKVPTTIICGLYNGYHWDITKYNMPRGRGSEKKGNSVRTQGALSPHCGLMHSAGYLCMYIITHVRMSNPHVTSQELLTALTANPLDVSD